MRPPCHIFLTGQPSVGKTTIIKAVIDYCVLRNEQNSSTQRTVQPVQPVQLSGFYTEEKRSSSNGSNESSGSKGNNSRVGFDLISFTNGADGNSTNITNCTNRASLSRSVPKVKKGDPCVGKYVVDVDNVDRLAVASLRQITERLERQMEQMKRDDASSSGSSPHPSDQLDQSHQRDQQRASSFQLCILDEVGKMEMLCPTFLPAVHDVMDVMSRYNQHVAQTDEPTGASEPNEANEPSEANEPNEPSEANEPFEANAPNAPNAHSSTSGIILGTIPTPRYGRVISAVEDIRAREDVIVVHVTKSNRDNLKNVLISLMKDALDGRQHRQHEPLREILKEFLYDRPLGSGSMGATGVASDANNAGATKQTKRNSDSSQSNTKASNKNSSNPVPANIIPCGPLLDSNIQPKVLILGHTASALPSDPSLSSLAYCERSMWNIFGHMFNIPFQPAKNVNSVDSVDSLSDRQIQEYQRLVEAVLGSGICIWDVLSRVHTKNSNNRIHRKRIRTKPNSTNNSNNSTTSPGNDANDAHGANDIPSFLKQHPSIRTICFIGAKAHSEFRKQFKQFSEESMSSWGGMGGIKLCTLPSSSPANSRMTVVKKVEEWRNCIILDVSSSAVSKNR